MNGKAFISISLSHRHEMDHVVAGICRVLVAVEIEPVIFVTTHDMIESVNHFVDMVMDGSSTHMAPRDVFKAMGYTDSMVHARQGVVVALTHSVSLRRMLNLASKILTRLVVHIIIVGIIEEAYRIMGDAKKKRKSGQDEAKASPSLPDVNA